MSPMQKRVPMQVLPGDATWVLVKGWHDQGGVEAVLGPYTEQRADWLLATVLDCSTYNWTKIELAQEPV